MEELRQGTFPQSTNWVSIPEAYLDPLNLPTSPVHFRLGLRVSQARSARNRLVAAVSHPSPRPAEPRSAQPPSAKFRRSTQRRTLKSAQSPSGQEEPAGSSRSTHHHLTTLVLASVASLGRHAGVVTPTAGATRRIGRLLLRRNAAGSSRTFASASPPQRVPEGMARVEWNASPGF